MVKLKSVWVTILVVLGLLGCAGYSFFTSPTWMLGKIQDLRLRIEGVHSGQVMAGGHRIHYYVRGPANGEPIVLIHGLGGRSEDFSNLAPHLERAGYRVYTPDLLGFGQSEEPTNASYSIDEQAQIVVGFFDSVGLSKPNLGGWSMGGWIAQKVAVDHPDRVKRLILMDSAGLRIAPDWEAGLFTPTTPAELDRLDSLLMPNPPRVPKFVAQDILRVSANYAWVTRRALASMMSARDVMDDELPTLRVPTLILWGEQDRITPLREGWALHALIPHSKIVVASGCGHSAPQSCTERLGPEMVRFLHNSHPRVAGGPLLQGD